MPWLMIARLMIKTETKKKTYHYRTIQLSCKNDSKEMLSFYLLCYLSILFSMQYSTLFTKNKTDNDVKKVYS